MTTTVDSEGRTRWPVYAYIREEVRRQGHNLANPADGGLRVTWMTRAWDFAMSKVAQGWERPTVPQIVTIGGMVEPLKNKDGLRRTFVRVGTRMCPHPDEVPGRLARLVEHGTDLEPLEFYRELELVHPFVDGNGRTGKIVLAWLAGSLDAPWFPPSDFWGHEITNP